MTDKKLKISSIQPYELNNKEHPRDQIELLKKMITEYGYDSPIIVNKDNVVIAGHARLIALTELDHKEVSVIVKDNLTKKQEQKYRLLDNKISELAKNNVDNIRIELQELQDEELNDLYDDIELETDDEQAKEAKEDVVREVALGIIKYGDKIKLGRHTLMCGNSMSEQDIQILLKDKNGETTHCISDPPYGIKYENEKHGMIQNDDKFLDYVELGKKYSDGFFAMWTGYQVVDKWMELMKNQFPITNMIIRHKGGGGLGDCLRTLAQDYEILLVANRKNSIQSDRGGAVRYRQQKDKEEYIKKAKKEELQSILTEMSLGQSIRKVGKDGASTYLHPTQKPVEINQRAIENFTAKGDNIIDLFGGSGSNLIAAQKTGRTMYMMELDEHYVETIIQRRSEYMNESDITINDEKVNWTDLVSNLKKDD